MTKVAFFYLNGTDPLLAKIGQALGEVFKLPRLGELTVPGLGGLTTVWQDGSPTNDPFCNLLDPQIFEARKIQYPALGIPMGLSLTVGINNMVNAINALPAGQKFMIGGYSQGAAAASSVMLRLRSGGDLFSARGGDFLGGVCFGNPRRQQDYRGEVGGTWSGAWDVPNSTTGGRGVFSATGPYPRLTNCDATKWIEFTEYGDIMSSTGASQTGLNWTEATNAFLDLLNLPAVINALLNLLDDVGEAFTTGGFVNTYTDAAQRTFDFPGNGHAAYPWRPPPGDPDNGLTSYQIAVKWLTAKASEYATAPILLPSEPVTTASAGWSTTLVPPAA